MRSTVLAKLIVAVGLVLGLFAGLLLVLGWFGGAPESLPSVGTTSPSSPPVDEDRFFAHGKLTVWWDREELPGQSTVALTKLETSNIHPADYAGPDSCKKCHRKNFDTWSEHPHRWMNALAKESTVKGDFSGPEISYLGGSAKFVGDQDNYRMIFERNSVRREYRVTQTIGSRFFQYYVGKLDRGPESPDHPSYAVDHVMPFGYWLDREEWIPVVHVGYDEQPDGRREDPFARTLPPTPLSPYYQCNSCHTTFALGDELTRNFWSLGRHPPFRLHWSMPDYVRETHSELMMVRKSPREFPNPAVEGLLIGMQQFEAPERAMALGVTCEACHLGCKDHANGKQEKPSFFPVSPHLHAETDKVNTGREHENVNWTCGRCHAGERPYYAGGMATWNSTEYSDATKGGCYSKLTCVNCHNPHQATGPKWSRSPSEDDASCLKCHEQLRDTESLAQHTHHSVESAGSRCMNCHMPRLNEGLQNVVRTHTIFSPTKPAMIEANQLNACNICHVEKPIDWTLQHLKTWYGATFSEAKIAANYSQRQEATAIGWLKSDNEAVRLAATDAMARSQDTSGLPALIDVLDDPFLLNRQFARIGLEQRFGIKLDEFGYRFYMTPDERREPVASIRRRLLNRVVE